MAKDGTLRGGRRENSGPKAKSLEQKIGGNMAYIKFKELSKYYRPPEGKFNEKSMRFANELGYKTIFWSLAYADWDNSNQPVPEKALKKILDNVHNGAVILLHPTSATNAAIMPELIKQLKMQGYRFGTLDELCNATGQEG